MKLPLVDEVRAARSAAIEAQRAHQDAARVDAALRALAWLEADGRAPEGAVPGDDELRDLSAEWPALAPAGATPVEGPRRLLVQRARLEAARDWLAPRGSEMMAAFAALGDLQRRQQEALGEPRWRRSVEAIRKRVEARDEVARALLPIESELVRLTILSAFLAEWGGRLAAAPTDEAAPMREALGGSLRPMLEDLPSTLAGEAAADPGDATAWAGLADRVAARRKTLGARAARLARQRDRLNGWLSERIG